MVHIRPSRTPASGRLANFRLAPAAGHRTPRAGADALERARKVLDVQARALDNLRGSLGDAFLAGADALAAARGRIVVTGMGKSGIVGRKIAATLASTGTPALFMHPAEAAHGDLGMVERGDVILALSNSGETEEVVALLPTFELLDITLVTMTGRPDSTLGRQADVVLEVAITDEGCPLGLAPMASTTAMLALGDALAAVLMELRGFDRNDYALRHPRGSLGRKLLTRVKDLMALGDRLPLVKAEFTMRTVIHTMIASNLGVAIAVDDDRKLLGILSDGDIKRLLDKKGDFFSYRMADVMSPDPIRCHPEELAEAALRRMEYNGRSQITVMPVTEQDGTVVGLVRMHEILQAKIR